MNKLRQIPVKTWTDNIINRIIIAINQLIDGGGGGGGGSVTVVDNLSSTSKTSALSANMGRVLNSNIINKYIKPDGGIPKSDLSTEVQNSLGKADTALQEHQDISGKQNKIQSTNFNRVIKSNGISISFKTDDNASVTIANIMLADSNNMVGLVTNTERTAIANISNKLNKPKEYSPLDMSAGWEDNTYYTLEDDVVTLNIPSQAIGNSINGILVFFHTATNFSSISYPNGTIWIGTDAPTVEADKYYLLSILNGYCSINEVSFQNPS